MDIKCERKRNIKQLERIMRMPSVGNYILEVGIPKENNQRSSFNGSETTNAVIGYLNEFGSIGKVPVPDIKGKHIEVKIPPRPHLRPGFKKSINFIKTRLKGGLKEKLMNGGSKYQSCLRDCGGLAIRNVKRIITSGELEPIHKAGKAIRYLRSKQRNVPYEEGDDRALLDTRQYYNALGYKVRNKWD